MRDADKNRDPERARKRAVADLRCAARKLGAETAYAVLAEMFGDDVAGRVERAPEGKAVNR